MWKNTYLFEDKWWFIIFLKKPDGFSYQQQNKTLSINTVINLDTDYEVPTILS